MQSSPVSEAWSGIFVYFSSAQRGVLGGLAVGYEVELSDVSVSEYYGLTQLQYGSTSGLSILSTSPVTFVPLSVTAFDIGLTCQTREQEGYEGLLVSLGPLLVVSSAPRHSSKLCA